MLTVPDKMLRRAISVISTTGLSEQEIEKKVGELAGDTMTARRLIDWIPEAFGMALIPHIGNVTLPTTFNAKASSGQWVEMQFDAEPIFGAALRVAMEMFHSGPRDKFSQIALRSAMVGTVNQALNAGKTIEGEVLSGPALIGIPAEVYSRG